MSKPPDCIHRGRIIGDACECSSDRFVGPNFAIRALSVCTHPCPFINKPNRGTEPPKPSPTTCIHLGKRARVARCRPCQAGGLPAKVNILRCAVHGECALDSRARSLTDNSRVQLCLTCDDFSPANPA